MINYKLVVFIILVFQILAGLNILGLTYIINSIVLVISSLLIAYLFYLNSLNKRSAIEFYNSKEITVITVGILTFISIIILSIYFSIEIKKYPISIKYSDVIPTMEYMLSEFCAGRSPYSVNTSLGYPIASAYFPFVWIPLLLPKILGLDIRYLLILIIGIVFFLISFLKRWRTLFNYSIILTLNILLILLIGNNKNDFFVSMEWLIMIYYCILCLSFFSNNAFIISISIILCLLSRYSFVFWLPLYVLVFYHFKGMALTRKVFMYTMVLFVLFFIPFLVIKNNLNLSLIFSGYGGAAIGEWYGQRWQTPNSLPFQLFGNGKGIAGLWYLFSNGSIEEKVHTFQKMHIIINVIFSGILSYLFIRSKKAITHYPLFLVASLSACMTMFFQFIQVPYNYLYFTIFGINAIGVIIVFFSHPCEEEIRK